VWEKNERREKTEEEKKQARERMERMRQFGAMGSRFMRGMDPDYISSPAPFGSYKIVLTVDGKEFTRYASILQDIWYDK